MKTNSALTPDLKQSKVKPQKPQPIKPELKKEIQEPINTSDLERQLIAKMVSGEITSDAYLLAMKTIKDKEQRHDLDYYGQNISPYIGTYI